MIYTVEEVAIKLNVSKVTIYNKLKLNQFKDKTVTKQGQTMIEDDLLNLIKDNLKVKSNFNMNGNIDTPEDLQYADDVVIKNDVLDMNKELLSALLDQLNEKDIQIHELNNRLATEQELNKNNQILQLKQPQDIKALEEHFVDLDNKLIDIKDKMQDRKEKQDQKSKGFLSKFLKK